MNRVLILFMAIAAHALLPAYSIASIHRADDAHLLRDDEIATHSRQWVLQVDILVAMLQVLLSKIESGFYIPNCTKQEAVCWLREVIKDLYRSIKKAQVSLTQERLGFLWHALHAYVEILQTTLHNNFLDVRVFSLEMSMGDAYCYTRDLILDHIRTLPAKLKKLQDAIDMSGLTIMNRVARKVEDIADLIHQKTNIYSWYDLLPYMPAALIFLRHLLPDKVQEIIGRYAYGCNSSGHGVVPQWTVGYAHKGVPQVKILNDSDVVGVLGRAERLYGSFIKLYFTLQIAKKFLDAKTLAIVEYIPTLLQEFLEEKWQRLKGIPFKSEVRYEIIDTIDLDDESLIGLDEQKEQLRLLVDYIINPEEYLSRKNIPEKGILLVGPSRVGKTLLAQALAGSINKEMRKRGMQNEMAFIEIKFDEIKQWKSQDAFERLINEARLHAPCILFLDELHTYGLQTASGDSSLYNTMLTVMNKLYNSHDPKDQVFIIGATNRPDLIAQELRSPKRFGKEIRFGFPNFIQRQQFFKHRLLDELVLDVTTLDIDAYARQTAGCSYGHLQSIVEVAKFNSNNSVIDHSTMQMALDSEVHRFLTHLTVSPEELSVLALHQAGHALVSYLLKPLCELELVTVRGYYKPIQEVLEVQIDKSRYHPNDQFEIEYGKMVWHNPYEAIGMIDARDVEKTVQIKMAGYLAEDLIHEHHVLSYHHTDKPEALELIKQLLFDGLKCSDSTTKSVFDITNDHEREKLCREIELKARSRLVELEDATRKLLVSQRDALSALTDALKKQLTLTSREVDGIIRAHVPRG